MSTTVNVRFLTREFEPKDAIWLRKRTVELPWHMMHDVLQEAIGVDVFVEGSPDVYLTDCDGLHVVEPLLASLVLDGPGLPPMKCLAVDIQVKIAAEMVVADLYFCSYAEYLGELYAGAPSSRVFFDDETTVLDTEIPAWMNTESSGTYEENTAT
jgi:hypothetical protein